jgi:DNA helicase II / ATP-dependent DNA helicase PcrA
VTQVDTIRAQILDGLDPDQLHAVTTPSRLVAVIAGAGSGKTRVLISRIMFRVTEADADPRHTLALTFTREAAGEMRRRLARQGLRERIEVGTFHSVLLGVLRQHWADRRQPIPTVVSDRPRLLREAMGRESRESLEELVAEIDWAAARGIDADNYIAAARSAGRRTTGSSSKVVDALHKYHKVKATRGVIDLDDVLSVSLGLFERDREFAEVMRWRFRHILIDEAQDLNPLQHRLVEHLRRGTEDMFMVGDPAQAVYGFNGADPGLLIDVADRFPGIEVIRLGTNHRCTPQVVDAGVHVLTTSQQNATAVMSSRADGSAVTVRAATDETNEAEMAIAFLRRCDPDLIRTGNVAVLARTHAQISVLRDLLGRHQVPIMTRVDGPGSPYRPAIEAAGRLGSAARLRAWAHDLLEEAEERAELRGPEREVAACVLDYLRENPMGDGLGLRTWFVTTDPLGHGKQMGVDLLTFHASKGREWHTVLVTGVETGLVPHRSASTQAARAEEARLLYVALTRARDRLWVSWAGRRGGYRRQISPLIQTLVTDNDLAVPPPIEVLAASTTNVARDLARDLHRDLLAWRAERARMAGMLPEQFCSTAVLRSIAEHKPLSADALAACSGVGVLTAERWLPSLGVVLTPTTPNDVTTNFDPNPRPGDLTSD